MNHNPTTYQYLTFSLLAAVLLTILIAFTPSTTQVPFTDNIVVTAAVIASCSLGVSLTLKPRWIRNRHLQQSEQKDTQHGQTRTFKGHHPDCSVFRNHTLQTKKKTWCAGCLGITIGLLLSIGLAITEAITQAPLTPNLLWLTVGFLCITIIYAEIVLTHHRPAIHVATNSLLGPGLAVIVFTTLQHTGQAVYGLFALLLGYLWTDTRIKLSQKRHARLCSMCNESCKCYPQLMMSGDYSHAD